MSTSSFILHIFTMNFLKMLAFFKCFHSLVCACSSSHLWFLFASFLSFRTMTRMFRIHSVCWVFYIFFSYGSMFHKAIGNLSFMVYGVLLPHNKNLRRYFIHLREKYFVSVSFEPVFFHTNLVALNLNCTIVNSTRST